MFYFNLDDGQIDLDQRGINFPDIPAARAEAVSTLADRLHDSNVRSLLTGKPWRLWVTSQPGGKGIVLFELQITAVN